MIKVGVYYLPFTNVLWYVTKVEYYEDLYNPPFAIINCYVQNGGFYKKVLITNEQFDKFIYVGEL